MTYGAKARRKPRLSMRLVAKWSLVAVLLIATAVVYVWQRNTIITLGYDIRDLKKSIRQSENEERKLQVTLATLQTAQRLLKEVEERQLGLLEPSSQQRMTVVAPRPLDFPRKRRTGIYDPPAASGPLARVSAATPHRENTVLRRRR